MRLAETRTGWSWRAWTPGCAPAIGGSTSRLPTGEGKEKASGSSGDGREKREPCRRSRLDRFYADRREREEKQRQLLLVPSASRKAGRARRVPTAKSQPFGGTSYRERRGTHTCMHASMHAPPTCTCTRVAEAILAALANANRAAALFLLPRFSLSPPTFLRAQGAGERLERAAPPAGRGRRLCRACALP